MIELFLLAAALGQSEDKYFEWRCSTKLEIDGHEAIMWRDFSEADLVGDYIIQTRVSDTLPNRTTWEIDPAPEGTPRERKSEYSKGRTESEVLANGPEYVSIRFRWYTKAVGPIWAYYWGDGEYAGAQKLYSAHKVRKYTDKHGKLGGLSTGLSAGPIMQSLASKTRWDVVAIDATGKQLFSHSFQPPNLNNSLESYRRKRSEIEKLEAEFRKDHKDLTVADTHCSKYDEEPIL